MQRDTCIFYRSFLAAVDMIPDISEKLELLMAIIRYSLDQQEPSFSSVTCSVAWQLIKPIIDKEWTNHNNGKKGGCPRGTKKPSMIGNKNAKKSSATQNPINTQSKTDIEKDNDEDDDEKEVLFSDSDLGVTRRERTFSPPNVEEIGSYMRTLEAPDGYAIQDGLEQRFYDFYDSKGWTVGNSPMSNWKATVRKWMKDPQNLNKINNGAAKTNTEGGRANYRSEIKSYIEKLEQRSIREANGE